MLLDGAAVRPPSVVSLLTPCLSCCWAPFLGTVAVFWIRPSRVRAVLLSAAAAFGGAEFVQMLSAEANDLCEADKKKTITPGHILRAMEKLGLERTLHS